MKQSAGLSVRILKELTSPASFQWNFRESFASLGKRMNVDEETIRLTLKKVVDEGVVTGWRLVVNPHLLGQQLQGLQIDVSDSGRKKEIIDQLKLVEGVLLILNFHGRGIRVVFYYSSSSALERKLKLICAICGFGDEVPRWISSIPYPKMKMRQIDWMILHIILKDPRMDMLPISRELGVSTRTVSRRLRLMTESNVAYLIPLREIKKSKGVLSCFLITCQEEQQQLIEKEIRTQGYEVDFVYTSIKNHFLVSLLTDNLATAEDLLLLIKNIEGIAEARLDIMKEFIFVDGWLEDTVNDFTLREESPWAAHSPAALDTSC